MGIPHELFEYEGDAELVAPAIARCLRKLVARRHPHREADLTDDATRPRLPHPRTPCRRRDHRAGLSGGAGMARAPSRPRADVLFDRRHGPGLVGGAGIGAGTPGQARDRARRRRQPFDESRHACHDREPGAEEPRPFRVRERHVRGQWRASDSRARAASSFAGLARAAGYAATFEFADLAAFEAAVADLLRGRGAGLRRSEARSRAIRRRRTTPSSTAPRRAPRSAPR